MKGYKVFNSDWTCRGFQYKVGETYKIDEKPELCQTGFHFCTDLKDCFKYYPYSKSTRIAEIEALGYIDSGIGTIFSASMGDTKHCTNEIKIVREIPFNKLYIQCESVMHWEEGYYLDYLDENVIYGINYEGHPLVDGKIIILKQEEVFHPLHLRDRAISMPPLYRRLVSFNMLTDVREICDERL